jgi:hypothetical protein
MTVLGKLEYVEIEFLAEWMGNQIGTKRKTLKSHAEELLKRKPTPIKILSQETKEKPKVAKKTPVKRTRKTSK